ncbi:MAG: transglycosylase SLT domain-containing protein [Archangium sp.]|nr:transglycosylase SLT domain-containing protein [Archangium sp.]
MLRIFLPLLIASRLAVAQSDALLESVRVHRTGVVEDAKRELETCVKAKCADRERLTLLTAFLELSEGSAEVAAQRLSEGKAPKGLEAFHGWYLGEAQSWAGQRSLALKTLVKARKSAPAWLQPRIDRRLAELHLDLGDAAKARTLLDADPDVARLPELLYTRALAREASKLTSLARDDWKSLALRFPTHPHGAAAQAKLEADGVWSLGFEEAVLRAQAMLDAGDSKKCLAALDAIEGAPVDEPKAALLRGQALLTRGKEKDTEAQAQLAIAAAGPPAIAAQALMTSAKRLMRLQDNAAARAAFRKLDLQYPGDRAADEAGYLAAWLAMNSGDFDAAVKDFIEFETRHPGSRRRDEARWFRGFSLIRGKKFSEARPVLSSLGVDFKKSQLVPQALYWAARAGQLQGAPDAGPAVDVVAEYRAVVNGYPGTFYGLLASERLQELSVEAPLPFAVTPKVLQVKRPPGLELAALLARAGLFRDAAQEVNRAVSTMPSADALKWGHALQALGDFGAAHTIAARHLWGAVYTQRSPEALSLMYPRAFRSSVETWALKHDVEPSLAWAIMRRESAFAPEVTSSADARGLMQIIPPTARSIALELKVPPADDAELYSPEWNIRLGTWYLRALTARLHHPTLVAAAYNGGPGSVARWAKERGEEQLDQWVEEIPFKETRGYVKQVTCDLFIYRQLYGGNVQRLSLAIPAPGTGVDF